VSKHKDLPAISGWMILYNVFEPVELLLVDGDFVRSVSGVAKDSGGEADEKSFVCNLTQELRRGFVVDFQHHVEILLVCLELVNAFQVCVRENRRCRG